MKGAVRRVNRRDERSVYEYFALDAYARALNLEV